MVKFINWLTGNEMWVSDERVNEYLAAGHKIAENKEVKKAEPKKTRKKAAKETR